MNLKLNGNHVLPSVGSDLRAEFSIGPYDLPLSFPHCPRLVRYPASKIPILSFPFLSLETKSADSVPIAKSNPVTFA